MDGGLPPNSWEWADNSATKNKIQKAQKNFFPGSFVLIGAKVVTNIR